MSSKIRLLASAMFGFLLVVGVCGCQFSYPFEISGVVQDTDGDPLADVTITLNAEGTRESSFPAITGTDGRFKSTARIGDIEFMREELPKWSLQLSKAGYETATIDISPTQKPASPRKTTIVSTSGTLKAK